VHNVHYVHLPILRPYPCKRDIRRILLKVLALLKVLLFFVYHRSLPEFTERTSEYVNRGWIQRLAVYPLRRALHTPHQASTRRHDLYRSRLELQALKKAVSRSSELPTSRII
jgi:hypothetical protein